MPLLCQVRIFRVVRAKDGAASSVQFVNHNLEAVEAVSWAPKSAPNAAFTNVLSILNNYP